MSTIKSYSVGNGDMFSIYHNSDNFTIIDCSIGESAQGAANLNELAFLSKTKGITRFISTHPDEDHILGLEKLDDRIGILNFYCVQNEATKEVETDSFRRYRALRDHQTKAYYIVDGCERKWMNLSDVQRGSSGISILWPDTSSEEFNQALLDAKGGRSPNNISPIIRYKLDEGASVLWMGDLEAEFMEAIKDEVTLPLVDVLFAPHHGRDSGKIPAAMLDAMEPRVIVIGEAPSEQINYYAGYHTITQNRAGDILFECVQGKVHIFTSNSYSVDFLEDERRALAGYYYLGTLDVSEERAAKSAISTSQSSFGVF